MATSKSKIKTETIHLQCSKCKRKNYTTTKNKQNVPEKIELNKYCKYDRKNTLHKEIKVSR